MPHILIVDDEPKILRLVHDFLQAAGFRTSSARGRLRLSFRHRRTVRFS